MDTTYAYEVLDLVEGGVAFRDIINAKNVDEAAFAAEIRVNGMDDENLGLNSITEGRAEIEIIGPLASYYECA